MAKTTVVPVLGPWILQAAQLISSVFPAPLNVLSAGIGVLAASVTLVVKLLDAPLGSGQRFRSLESKLARRPGVKNPAALAATIGRRKYGAAKLQRLSLRGRRRAKR
jgi:hypothetical protein